jgi:hypothetical protein
LSIKRADVATKRVNESDSLDPVEMNQWDLNSVNENRHGSMATIAQQPNGLGTKWYIARLRQRTYQRM